ncbi:MAG: DUF393 domain-containing protein [Chlorobi bacterium]|nr:DUF393 domain-containing protein [Chlorobiota bacterium]
MENGKFKSVNNIIFFDGICNLCTWSVQFVVKRDKKGIFKFSSLQSDFAKIFFKESRFNIENQDSIILLANNILFTESDAILEIIKKLKGIWPVLYLFKIFPKKIRDKIYQFIAKNRYCWFGKRNECYIPEQNNFNIFIES